MATIFSREGFPSVSVPVLSVISTSTLSIFSNASAFFISTPDLAPLPTPTITDMGVANPSAQGHAIMSTAMAFTKAYTNLGSGPNNHHITKVITDIITTMGTKYLEILSTKF